MKQKQVPGAGLQLSTIAVHAGYQGDPATGSVVQPIYPSTTFERNPGGEIGEYIYTREDNPNRKAAEAKLAALEGGQEAIAFSSGMAATNAVFQSVLFPGSHLILPDDCYHGTRALLLDILNRWQVQYSEVDQSNLSLLQAAIRPNTQLIWLETPSNPLLKIADIAAIAEIARQKGILLAVDNTWATPFFQRPFELGADLVMHSSTKYLGGHSDLLGGCIVVRENAGLVERIRTFQHIGGAVPAPFDCWLLNRSLSTFPLRMPVHAENARRIAEFLQEHPRIERVMYPGLPAHPGHEVAVRQMKGGFGGMLSVQVKGGQTEAMRFAGSLQIFRHATSLGGVESLIEHRRSSEGLHPKSPDNLLRLSIGIEAIDDLLDDLREGLGS